MKRVGLIALLVILSGCASTHEQLIRWHYLSSGRGPEGWAPKKSLCPDFARNGWQDHAPVKDGCFAPPPVVGKAAR
jgi:carbonic anhydrase